MKLLRNIKIYDYVNFIENGYCIFDEKIIEVGHMNDLNTEDFKGIIIDGNGKLLMPGLVNFHAHIYSTLVRGLALEFNPKSFQDILDQMWWRFDKELDNENSYNSAMIFGLESLKSGVTTLIDHHASGVDIEGSLEELRAAICTDLGMRGSFCFETSDRFDVEACIRENELASQWHESDVRGLFGIHASMSISNETIEKIKKSVLCQFNNREENTPIHIHVAESLEDLEDALMKYGKSVVERLDEHGLIVEDSILAHCVHITHGDAEIIRRNKAVIALNPTSNLNNTVGIFNIDIFRDNGIPIVIGTDGLGVNVGKEWANLYYIGKSKLMDPVGIGINEIQDYIVDSYRYLGRVLGTQIGLIKENYVSDFMLIDYKNPTPMGSDNAFGHVFYGILDNMKPSDVWIKGAGVIRQYQSIFDEELIYTNARASATKLWERIGD